jgi:hypothetical protein
MTKFIISQKLHWTRFDPPVEVVVAHVHEDDLYGKKVTRYDVILHGEIIEYIREAELRVIT